MARKVVVQVAKQPKPLSSKQMVRLTLIHSVMKKARELSRNYVTMSADKGNQTPEQVPLDEERISELMKKDYVLCPY